MKTYRYVKLDPTGNITCLVLDPTEPQDEKAVTRKLLEECEQVAYLEAPTQPGAVAAIRLMGGEFCGNAAMAAAAWLVREELADPVRCTVRKTAVGFEGTTEMPPVQEIREEMFSRIPFTLVRMQGIVHLIHTGAELGNAKAEKLLAVKAAVLPDEAIGLLQWNPENGFLTPLVWVRGSESMVWENACGSGSAAVGAAEALRAGNGTKTTQVSQPGGTISVSAEARDGQILSVAITGQIRLGTETAVEIP